jgi:hypothetical protein
MNKFIQYIATFLPIACLALLTHSVQGQSFQGTVLLNTTNPAIQEEAVVQWMTDGGNHKLLMNGTANGQSFSYTVLMLKNETSVRILTEMNGQKVMFVTPLADVKPNSATLGNAAVTTGDGSTTLVGYNCKKYTVESAEGSTTVFVTNQVSLNVNDLPALLQKNGVFATLSANNITGLPLSVVSRGADGKVLFSQTVTGVKPGPVAASEFSYEGYGDGGAAMQNTMKQD